MVNETLEFTLITGDRSETVQVPAKYSVCHSCEGTGRRLTPSLRGAITEEDRQEWDEDAWAEYLKGGHGIYGVECETCAGKRVVLVMDEERIDKKLSARIHREVRRRAREREEDRRTYNMECQIFND